MAKLNHEPADVEEGFPEGIYHIKVKELIYPYLFKKNETTGIQNQGMRICFETWNSNGQVFDNWENVVTTSKKAKWRLKELWYSLGLDYDDEDLDTDEFKDKTGKASMHREPGEKYLSVDHYLAIDSEDEVSGSVTNSVDASGEPMPF